MSVMECPILIVGAAGVTEPTTSAEFVTTSVASDVIVEGVGEELSVTATQ